MNGQNDTQPGVPQTENLSATGKAGAPIALPIARGPATGYDWRLELPDGVRQIEDKAAPPPEPSRALGAPAGGVLQVTAPAGDYLITARLVRPWEPNEPGRLVLIHLHVE